MPDNPKIKPVKKHVSAPEIAVHQVHQCDDKTRELSHLDFGLACWNAGRRFGRKEIRVVRPKPKRRSK